MIDRWILLCDCFFFQMNSLKDLYLLLEEDNLTSPAHQADKRAAADEQPLSPTIKVGGHIHTHADAHTCAYILLVSFPFSLALWAAPWQTWGWRCRIWAESCDRRDKAPRNSPSSSQRPRHHGKWRGPSWRAWSRRYELLGRKKKNDRSMSDGLLHPCWFHFPFSFWSGYSVHQSGSSGV